VVRGASVTGGTTSGDVSVAILSYHKIGASPDPDWESWYYVSREKFREDLLTLLRNDWQPVDLNTLLHAIDHPTTLDHRCALVTFDDAYRSLVDEAVPILDELGFPSVVFVPTAYLGQMNDFDSGEEPGEPICDWDDLRVLAQHGVSVQSHGVNHVPMSELARSAQAAELAASRAAIEDGIGSPVTTFAFPYGDEGRAPAEMGAQLRAAGYRAAFLYGGGPADLRSHDRYRLPRLAMGADTNLLELLE